MSYNEGTLLIGRRRGAQEPQWAAGGGDMVAVRVHHHRLVHGEPGRIPHRVTTRHAHRVPGRTQQAVQDPVRTPAGLLHRDVLQAHVRDREQILRVIVSTYP